ncbi:autophagy-related protein 11-domain-containing protein [Lineolata rhizophorae]|uniref:Autophagy-related protein 11 n=1 Tax=Lineolata rhizophorae TaxID=578093 RepID=A0A6A6P2E4_9PEZI|nr:autophagy-related protein 11-domain-containing protein [Lineolata rhizophorae]
MSLHVFVAHTGKRLEADPVSFDSLEALRSWLAKATSIPPQDQILLTTRGKHVKLQALLTEKDIFLYDRDLFKPAADGPAVSPTPIPEAFRPTEPPNDLANQNDLRSWQNLFKARREWTMALVERARVSAGVAQTHMDEQAIIERSLRVATGNHQTHIRSLRQKQADAQAWFDDVSREQEENAKSWEGELERLDHVIANEEFIPFILATADAASKARAGRLRSSVPLSSFVDREELRTAATVTRQISSEFRKRISDIGGTIENIAADYGELISGMDQSQSTSTSVDREEPTRLLEEIEIVAKKVAADYDHILSLPANSKSVAQVSKMALLHTRNYLPTMSEYSLEMGELLRRSVEMKNAAVELSIQRMQAIAGIESALSGVNSQLSSLDIPPDGMEAFEMLSLVGRLPFVYGSLLIESIKRREWTERMKKDASSVAEELAGYQEEEERRRKKWLKSMSDFINVDSLQSKTLGVEVYVHGEEHAWPYVSRESLSEYISSLQETEGLDTAAQPLFQLMRDLDKPTKQQTRQARHFKMGSVHDAAFGKNSLMLQNSKLEEELKSSKSRVRKLEDLLHRQSQLNRIGSGTGFQPSVGQTPDTSMPETGPPPSPRLQDNLSRRSSVSSRRFSANQTNEEKSLARRIVKLEADLMAEREQRESFERQATTRKDSEAEMQTKIAEANSTKKDLLENMEAQQREFANERKSLEEDLANYKNRIEEVEDELDRLLGSRDNERTGTDAKIHSLIAELDQLRKEAAEDVHNANSRVRELESAVKEKEESEKTQTSELEAIHRRLAPDSGAPANLSELIESLQNIAQRSTQRIEKLSKALELAESRNADLQKASEEQRSENVLLQSRLEAAQAEAAETRQGLDKKVEKLTTQLHDSNSHANSLDVELSSLQKRYEMMHNSSGSDAERLQQRSERAREVSKRLFTQYNKLQRLLEIMGFAVSFQDNAMIIQRASKAAASQVLADSTTGSRTLVSPPPGQRKTTDETERVFVDWITDDLESERAKFAEFVGGVDRFNIDTFCKAMAARLRDLEHTARKWQKEAKLYRDKAHRAQTDAHDKIAFRAFKEGDLALFLPTRNQATRPWAAFNIGAPHYFLREQDSHRLQNRDWLVARISKVEERVVNLSRTMDGTRGSGSSGTTGPAAVDRRISGGDDASLEDDNPFELSDGLRWYLLDATEEKAGAPSTPGLAGQGKAKSTVASTHVDARGSIRVKKSGAGNDASRTLNKSLDSRRSSSTSKKSFLGGPGASSLSKAASSEGLHAGEGGGGSPEAGQGPSDLHGPSANLKRPASTLDHTAESAAAADAAANEEVRKDLLFGP